MISNGRDAKRFKNKGRNGIMKIKFLLKFSQPISEYFFFFNKNFGIYRNFFKVSEYKNAVLSFKY